MQSQAQAPPRRPPRAKKRYSCPTSVAEAKSRFTKNTTSFQLIYLRNVLHFYFMYQLFLLVILRSIIPTWHQFYYLITPVIHAYVTDHSASSSSSSSCVPNIIAGMIIANTLTSLGLMSAWLHLLLIPAITSAPVCLHAVFRVPSTTYYDDVLVRVRVPFNSAYYYNHAHTPSSLSLIW